MEKKTEESIKELARMSVEIEDLEEEIDETLKECNKILKGGVV